MSTIQFVGTELIYDAFIGVANELTISLQGDQYTFRDTAEQIADVINAPPACNIDQLEGNAGVIIECATNLISLITLNMNDFDDSVVVESARDGLSVPSDSGDDSVTLAGPLNLEGGLEVVTESISLGGDIQTVGIINLVVPDSPLPGDDLIIPSFLSIESTAGAINLLAGDDISVQVGSSVAAFGALAMEVDFGNADVGVGSNATVIGTIDGSTISLMGDDDDDTFFVRANRVPADLTIDGKSGLNTLTLDDADDATGDVVTITSTSVGVAPGDNFFGPGGRLVSYTNLSDLQINLGSGGNQSTILSTHTAATTVIGGSGSDSFFVGDAFSSLDDIMGVLSVDGGGGLDLLALDDQGETDSNSYEILDVSILRGDSLPVVFPSTVVEYNQIETVELSTGNNDDSVLTQAFGLGFPNVNVSTGDGDDVFTVNLGVPPTTTLINLDGGIGQDSFDINASDSPDEITFNGQIVAGQTIIVPTNIEDFTVAAGEGDDMIDVSQANMGVTVFAGGGNDTVKGGSGDDIIFGGTGNDMINSGAGNDVINTGDGNDIIFGGSGNDMVNAGDGDDVVNTGDGNDIIFGSSGNDTIDAGAGNDVINTGDGNDVIFGGTGNDMVNAGAGNDVINTGDGNDIIFGGTGNDTVNSGAGNDVINTGDGNDIIFGGSGNDVINTGDGNDVIFGGDGDDSLSGGDGDDILFGGAGDEILDGGGGDDTYIFSGDNLGSDQIIEPPNIDTDTLDFSGLAGSVAIDLAILALQSVSPGILDLQFVDAANPFATVFAGIENVVGSGFADQIFGNNRDNVLRGADLFDFAPTPQPAVTADTQWVLLDFDTETDPGEWTYSTDERNAIQSRIEGDYALFDFAFTQNEAEIPTTTYATLFFNDLRSQGQPGQADEVDFRNVNLDGTAGIDVQQILGGEGELALNSDNVIAASSFIGAHELGHLVGLRHGDSFGPIGFGIHSPPGAERFQPDYPGLDNAFETTSHLMGSPASVGASVDVVGDPFFSERSAIKLAFNENGTVVNEAPGDHGTPATAHPISLSGLFVPNPLLAGLNSAKLFAVKAIDVVGTIDLESPGGVSESDVYEFTGQTGDIFTFEVISAIDRIAAQINPVLRILDATGSVLAFFDDFAENNDSFEVSDSLLVDFPIPNDGSYFVEVDTFSVVGHPDQATLCGPGGEFEGTTACTDTDTGEYELFIFRFDAGNPSDQGDVLAGRGGNDVLEGGLGDDVLNGGAGDDVMDGDLGNDTMLIAPGSVDRVVDLHDVTGGIDVLNFSRSSAGISIDISIDDGTPQVVDSGGNMVAIEGLFENVIGSRFADTIWGNAKNNTIYGRGGDDFIRARTGSDRLFGGSGNDILLGGSGNDFIVGQDGLDVIIGGLGSDRLIGGNDDDVLIGGTTTHDATDLALLQILDEWTSGASFEIRFHHLHNGIGVPKLDDTTVFDDLAVDLLDGGVGRDWILSFPNDRVRDADGS